jgi:fluoroquinolone transport system ATP-binding protein
MIVVRDLAFTYPKSPRPALRGLDFRVEDGEILGFLGPSGAGKSTTQKILIGLLRSYTGTVEFQGRELKDWSRDFYERIGVAFEFPTHFLKLTAEENLAYFGRLYAAPRGREPIAELLERVGLAGDARKPVGRFSKGMKNRLGVAKALLHRPEVLFLDEPTAGLDPVNARAVKELIRAQKEQGRTVVLTTHDMAVADELCDRVAFLVDGSIPVIAPPRDLKLRHGRAKVRVEVSGRDGGPVTAREFPLEGLGDDAEFLALLRSGTVEAMHSQEATLEDVFIRVTGRGLA